MKPSYLCDVQICLHHEEWIESVGTRCIRVVEEIFHFGERSLPEAGSPVFWRNVLAVRLLESERFRCMRKGGNDPGVQRLDLFQSSSEELPLRR